jgi:catechol 2,3-dioxygenase-like lactoylglutathione lyase family enzyme
MLHHVTLEVAPADLERAAEFWTLLGFVEVEPPADLAATFTWFEHGGTQIHLMRTESPTIPPHGHAAIVAPDFARTVERLAEAGFEVVAKRERWGSPRALATAPGGHRVELMAAAPTPRESRPRPR